MASKKCFLDFVLGDSNMEVEKKRPREPSEPGDDVSEGRRSEGRRSTTPEPAKKKKKVDPVCSFTKKINLTNVGKLHALIWLRIFKVSA